MSKEDRAWDKLESALEDLSAAGYSYLATTLRLTVENEKAESVRRFGEARSGGTKCSD